MNVDPYKYSHYQKNEIEKIVVGLLKNGVIWASTSYCAKYPHKLIGKYLVRFIYKCTRSNDSTFRQIRDHSYEN
jgi:hypothetical protein